MSRRRPAIRAGRRSGQRGLTPLGLLLALIPIILVALVVIKAVPAYYEHQRIVAVLRAMDESGQTVEASDLDLRRSFERRAQIEDIQSVAPADLVIDKAGDRKLVHVDYAAKVPLMDRVSLLIEFSASSAPGSGHP